MPLSHKGKKCDAQYGCEEIINDDLITNLSEQLHGLSPCGMTNIGNALCYVKKII